MRIALAAALVSLWVAGCATTAPQAPAPSAPVSSLAGPPADDALNATVWYQTALERDLVYRGLYRAAADHLDAALADTSWDALPKEDRRVDARALPPAIIVDVDETVLDNAPNQVRQIREHRSYVSAKWAEWVMEGKAKALPGARDFLAGAARRGVTVFYVTNRKLSQAGATLANLRAEGFPVSDASQLLPADTAIAGCVEAKDDKNCRRQRVGQTHRVVMLFGDQVGDFVRIETNTPDGRRNAMAPYLQWIGERWFVLPNPLYGSWESAVSGNGDTPEARRAAKEAALDDATK